MAHCKQSDCLYCYPLMLWKESTRFIKLYQNEDTRDSVEMTFQFDVKWHWTLMAAVVFRNFRNIFFPQFFSLSILDFVGNEAGAKKRKNWIIKGYWHVQVWLSFVPWNVLTICVCLPDCSHDNFCLISHVSISSQQNYQIFPTPIGLVLV